jgi:hypothetical protein
MRLAAVTKAREYTCADERAPPRRRSWPGPRCGSPPTASATSTAWSPTTAPATAPVTSPRIVIATTRNQRTRPFTRGTTARPSATSGSWPRKCSKRSKGPVVGYRHAVQNGTGHRAEPLMPSRRTEATEVCTHDHQYRTARRALQGRCGVFVSHLELEAHVWELGSPRSRDLPESVAYAAFELVQVALGERCVPGHSGCPRHACTARTATPRRCVSTRACSSTWLAPVSASPMTTGPVRPTDQSSETTTSALSLWLPRS